MKIDKDLNQVELIKSIQDNTSEKNVSLNELMKNNYKLGVSTVEGVVDEYWEPILGEIFINKSSIINGLVPVAAAAMLNSIKTFNTELGDEKDFQLYAENNIKNDLKKYIEKLSSNRSETIPGSLFNLGNYRVSWAIDETKTRIAIVLDSSAPINDFRHEFGMCNKAYPNKNGEQLLIEFNEKGES